MPLGCLGGQVYLIWGISIDDDETRKTRKRKTNHADPRPTEPREAPANETSLEQFGGTAEPGRANQAPLSRTPVAPLPGPRRVGLDWISMSPRRGGPTLSLCMYVCHHSSLSRENRSEESGTSGQRSSGRSNTSHKILPSAVLSGEGGRSLWRENCSGYMYE